MKNTSQAMKVRPATPEDAARLSEIYAHYVDETAVTFEYTAPTEAEFARRIAHTLERYPYLVVQREDEVVGYAYAGPLKERAAYDWACETTVYLDHTARRQGAGRLLYEALEAELRAMGIVNLYACIAYPIAEDEYLTLDSVRFHERLGFREIGRFHSCGYKFGRWYDMVWMEKLVGDHVATQPPVHPWTE